MEADLRDKRILRLYRRWSTRAAKTYTSGPRDRLGEERDERRKIPLAQRGIEKQYIGFKIAFIHGHHSAAS